MDPSPQALEALFMTSPIPTVLCRERGAGVVTERLNGSAERLMASDDGRSAAVIGGLGRTALTEQEPLRRARLELPHRPHRRYNAHALPLDGHTAAVLLEDITETLARREELSMWHDVADRLEDAFVACRTTEHGVDATALPVLAANTRLKVLAGLDRIPPGTALRDVLDPIFGPADFAQVSQSLGGRNGGERSWRLERAGRAWRCRAWTCDERLVIQISDLTERGQLARALSDHARLLRVANDELDQVTHALRRAVREPLRQGLDIGHRLDDELRASPRADLHALLRIFQRVDGAVADLLAYTSITRTPLTGGTVELSRLIDRAVESLEPQIARRPFEVRAPPLPTVWGQERLLELLLTQLIAHSLMWSAVDEAGLIDIGFERRGDMWRITVSTTGDGADQHPVQGMLDALRTGPGGGPGMGLAICRRIVEHHGGEIGAEPRPGGGTRLWFELPTIQAAMR